MNKQRLSHNEHHAKPDFLIIGAQRCGTTSLFRYLSHHLSLSAAKEKEPGFFFDTAQYVKGEDWYLNTYYPPITDENRHKLFFEATPEYLYYPVCAERISSYNKKMKMIVTLRDPVERAYSAWNMFKNFKHNPKYHALTEYRDFRGSILSEIDLLKHSKSFDDSLQTALERSYVRRGLYFFQLKRYFHFFSPEDIYITEIKLLQTYTRKVLDEITDFLEIPGSNLDDVSLIAYNPGRYESKTMPIDVIEMLANFYRPYNLELFELLKREFDWMS